MVARFEVAASFDSQEWPDAPGEVWCTCTFSKTDSTINGTTYTINGSPVTTADGETYSICEQGSTFKYKGKSAGAEEGNFEPKKR